MRRWAALWAVLFAAYAATLGLDAFRASDYGGDEPHYLLTAESIVTDGDVDLTDEYAARDYDEFYPYPLDRHGRADRRADQRAARDRLPAADRSRLRARRGEGGRAVAGGDRGAGVRAGGGAGAPGGAGAVGDRAARWRSALSPPALAYGATVYPELTAGAALAAAALLAVSRARAPAPADRRWPPRC